MYISSQPTRTPSAQMASESHMHDNNNNDFALEAHDDENYYEDDYDDDYDEYDQYEPRPRAGIFQEDDDEDDGGFDREFTVDEEDVTRSFRSFTVRSTNNPPPRAPAAALVAADASTTTTLVAAEAKEGEDTCIICLDKVPDCKFVDCNHLNNTGYICCICADKLVKGSRKCPLCRADVTRYEVVVVAADKSDNDEVPDSWED